MSIAFLAALLVVSAVVLFIFQPILTGEEAPLHRQAGELTDAEARKRVALMALRDAEYDFETGKLNSLDYDELRAELASEALSALDDEEAEARAAGQEGGGPPGSTPESSAERDVLEAEIARYREALRGGVLCDRCGRANPATSRFCGSCGTALRVPAPQGG